MIDDFDHSDPLNIPSASEEAVAESAAIGRALPEGDGAAASATLSSWNDPFTKEEREEIDRKQARYQALEQANRVCGTHEPAAKVVERAKAYFEFLTGE